jgi:hypothetical protein
LASVQNQYQTARTLSSFKQLEKLHTRQAIKRIYRACTHSHSNNQRERTLECKSNVLECAVYLQLIHYNQSHNTISQSQSVSRKQSVAISLSQSTFSRASLARFDQPDPALLLQALLSPHALQTPLPRHANEPACNTGQQL